MPGPTNTLLIEGSFEELADELAHYLDDVKTKDGDAKTTIQTEIAPLLEQNQKDEVLKKLVTGGAVLNSAPEKGQATVGEEPPDMFRLIYDNRVHCSLQSPSPPRPSNLQSQHVPTEDMSKPLRSHYFL